MKVNWVSLCQCLSVTVDFSRSNGEPEARSLVKAVRHHLSGNDPGMTKDQVSECLKKYQSDPVIMEWRKQKWILAKEGPK